MDEQPGKAPQWAIYLAGTVLVIIPALLTAAYGIVRFVSWVKDQRREHRDKDNKLISDQQLAKEEQIQQREKTALDRANELIERLTKQVEAHDQRVQQVQTRFEQVVNALEERERTSREKTARCEAEHAGTKALLKLVALWAKRKGMPMTPELNQLIEDTKAMGSGDHPPLSGGNQ